MMNKRLKKESGFTLIESILYLSLFVLLSTVLIDSLIVMSKTYNDIRVSNDLLDSMSVPIERISREIRGAASINLSGSTFGVNPSTLSLNVGTSTTESFSLLSGAIRFVDTGGEINNLTSDKVSVDSLVFRNITTTLGHAVKIEITLHSTRFPNGRSVSVSDTIVMRQNY